MKILVTGAAGFIGSHLSERLKKSGHDVIGLDCFYDYYSLELKELNARDLKSQGIDVYKLNLIDGDLTEISRGVEVVFHFAAQPGISSSTPFEGFLNNNIIATKKLLDAFENSNSLRMFINTATSSVYGVHATGGEDAACKPTSFYGVTKLAAEQLVLSYQRDKGFPACSVRPFSVYGERERPEKLYPRLIDAIYKDKEFPLFEGSEAHIRSYTYVGDIVDGYVAILEKYEQCMGEIFNLGTDEAITTGEGIKIIEDIMGKKAKLKITPKRAGDQKETKANIGKARQILGYNPTTKPEDGLKKEVDWFVEKVFKSGIDLYK